MPLMQTCVFAQATIDRLSTRKLSSMISDHSSRIEILEIIGHHLAFEHYPLIHYFNTVLHFLEHNTNRRLSCFNLNNAEIRMRTFSYFIMLRRQLLIASGNHSSLIRMLMN